MRNKKVSLTIIIFAIVVLVAGVIIKVGFCGKEKLATIEGEITKVNDIQIIFEEENGGTFSVNKVITPNVVFDENGNRSDMRKLQVGQHIVVKYSGGIQESIPGGVLGVVEIIVEE